MTPMAHRPRHVALWRLALGEFRSLRAAGELIFIVAMFAIIFAVCVLGADRGGAG